ncbi:phage shock protein C, PspC [Pseudopedobacter saltans DSM 12145]|uniref:Phage shock protein C, PspC n=1 Tax=Pseudopedobacter saltans (strain ATCC 51119 / DSM 12145 / JCM 21818 / CCUG 39354 / LMG 10337 / NBRC 100064 / NCIMB 13643) TaxID=762903 RepID=F0SCF7_PSESL|nr:PspC domain-containing protein [Pseudopedobacter saltans]ADY52791.1 phage shock protein C, PspC [Pseudopedobacter saltans DSM 12145]
MTKKLTRNTRDKVIAGVSSGLADYFQLDVIWVRIAFVLATFFGGTGLWIYIILWIAIPENRTVVFSFSGEEPPTPEDKFAGEKLKIKEERNFNGKLIGGSLLIAFGSYFLLEEFDLLPRWFSLDKLWPLIFIGIGLFIIFKTVRKENAMADKGQEKNPVVEVEEDKKEDENTSF